MDTTSDPIPQTLVGKVAIITGGSRGIGAAIAWEFAQRGAKVAITYVSPSSKALSEALITKIKSLPNGTSAISIQADSTSLTSPQKIISQTLSAFGPSIDILVNNAGIECSKPLLDITPADYETTFATNIRGVLFTTQAVVPHLRAPGRIINIGSVIGRIGFPGTSVYAGSKAAVEGMSRSWAAELGAVGHTVNTINPGLVETDMLTAVGEKLGEGFEGALGVQKMLTPLENRIAQVDDVALVAVMLAEANSRWITGQGIQASGGIYMN